MSQGNAKPNRKSAARLMAVQAIYQMMASGQSASEIIEEYQNYRAGTSASSDDSEQIIKPDSKLFKILVSGVADEKDALDKIIHTHFQPGNEESDSKPEPLLRALLRCAVLELKSFQDTDFKVILSEYLNISHAFYNGAEPGLINAILDSARKDIRG